MPRKTIQVLTDDFDGKELPEDTSPVTLSLGRTTYSLYLSDKNHGKLMDALTPFITDAETISATAAARPARKAAASGTSSTVDTYGFPTADVRKWAQETGYKQSGNGKAVGDKGRIPQDVYDAYKAAN